MVIFLAAAAAMTLPTRPASLAEASVKRTSVLLDRALPIALQQA